VDSPDSVLDTIDRISRRERRLIDSFRGEGQRMGADAEKLTALVETARALDAAAIPYALIGGLAVGIHSGTPRATLDVDVAALTSAGRARVVAALEGAGFRRMGEHEHSVNFRHASGEPVQVAFDETFDAMILRAEQFELAGTRVRLVTREDLVVMKERAAADPTRRKSKRLRDRADVELLRGDVPDPDEGW
jgi:predicted nucleotidyltransferase